MPAGLSENDRKKYIDLQIKIDAIDSDRLLQKSAEVEEKDSSAVVAVDNKYSMEAIASNNTKSDLQKVHKSDLKDDRRETGSAVESHAQRNLAINQVKIDGSNGEYDPKAVCEKARADIQALQKKMNNTDPTSKERLQLEKKDIKENKSIKRVNYSFGATGKATTKNGNEI